MSSRLKYTQDLRYPPFDEVLIIRSSISSGSIKHIELPPLPKGYSCILAKDIPGKNQLAPPAKDVVLLANSEISYYGQPIALLAGPDFAVLIKLAHKIDIEYEEQKGQYNYVKFSAEKLLGKQRLSKGDSENLTLLEDDTKKIETGIKISAQEHWYPEPHTAFARYDKKKITVNIGTQWPFHVRSSCAQGLDRPMTEILIEPMETGQHMDGKIWYPSLIACLCALACSITQKNTRLALSREEDFLCSPKSPAMSINIKSCLSKEGHLQASHLVAHIEGGAACPFLQEIMTRLCVGATGSYDCANITAEVFAVRTNTPPSGPFAGYGLSQAFFAIENHVQNICEHLKIDPVEWRLKNVIHRASLLNGNIVAKDIVDIKSLVQVCLEISDYKRKWASYELMRKGDKTRLLRGIGFSLTWQNSGFMNNSDLAAVQEVKATLDKNSKLEIVTSAISSSSETAVIWRQMAADLLNIEIKQVRIKEDTRDVLQDAGPASLSRNTAIITNLIERCCKSIQKQRFREALPITVTRKARTSSVLGKSKQASLSGLSWASTVAEIEIDPSDFAIHIRGIWMNIDAGSILNEKIARSSVETACYQATSAFLCESVDWNQGIPNSDNFKNYGFLPLAKSPEMTIHFNQKEKTTPKGIGDLPFIGVPSAISQAISQAINAPINSFPLDPRSIISALELT